jgi:hypothetical protein
MLNPTDEAALRDLSWHSENVYAFAVVDNTWTAIPADDPADILTAESASELRELIRADYAERHPAAQASTYLQERLST